MPNFKVTTQDGQEGTFDPVEHIVATNPDLAKARITGWDPKTKTIKATSDQGEMELNVPEYAKSLGLNTGDLVGEFNDPKTAVDSSPVSLWQRFKLGLANSESGEVKDLISRLQANSSAPVLDALSEKNQKRALTFLRSEFKDAKYVNGEYVVKQDGVWHKVDAPGISSGDVAQFAASNGLNILGGIAGGTLGLLGGPLGAAAGAGIGSGLGEAAEEALRMGLVGGQVDFNGVQQDIMTEAIMGLAGEGAGRGVVAGVKAGGNLALKGAKAALPEAVTQSAEAIATQKIRAFKAFAASAADQVKEMAAGLGAFGPGMSKNATKAMLESPETVQEAVRASKLASTPDGLQFVHNEIKDLTQNAWRALKKANQDQFGEFIDQVQKEAAKPENAGKVNLNLNDLHNELSAILETAAKDDRGFLDVARNTVKELIDKAGNKAPKRQLLDHMGRTIQTEEKATVLSGPRALEELRKLKEIVSNNLETLGAYNEGTNVVVNSSTQNAATRMFALIDNKLSESIAALNLSAEAKAANALYGEAKDAIFKLQGKVFSPKMDVDNAVKIARGEIGEAAADSIIQLDKMFPKVGLKKALDKAAVKQSGIESQRMWALPKGEFKSAITASGATGAVLATNGAALPLVLPLVSPRSAAFVSRNMTTSGGLYQGAKAIAGSAVQNATKAINMTNEAAQKAASLLLSRASVAGFIHTLPRIERQKLLKDPEAFQQLMQKAGILEQKVQGIDEKTVTEQAIKRSQEKGQ